LDLCHDAFGSHVVEKIITCFDENYISFVYDKIISNFMLLANNNNGLCVVKKIIIHALNKETILTIQSILIENSVYLIQNPYGNYSLQVAFDVIYI